MIKVIAFDVFGTLLDMKGVPREEIAAYVKHCLKRPWSPLELPESWKNLQPFPDVPSGIERLRAKLDVTTCSNGTWEVLEATLNDSTVIDFVNLEAYYTFKPDPLAYMAVCKCYSVEPSDVLFVTANPTFGPFPFGDVEMARLLGMQAQLIRNPGTPQTIIGLAEQLGC